jgi:cytochrome c peroxidase
VYLNALNLYLQAVNFSERIIMKKFAFFVALTAVAVIGQAADKAYVFKPGHRSLKGFLLPASASYSKDNVSNNAPFDRWVKGDANAMTAQQVSGFEVFMGRGNCESCHSGANFTDNRSHNLSPASVKLAQGSFKTPSLRNIAGTAPYFHDGSAKTLTDGLAHYNTSGAVKTKLSPNKEPLDLTIDEQDALVAFMEALTSPNMPVRAHELAIK